MSKRLFTSESVSEGHPDKVADQISDAVLDAMLKDDPTARVACETLVTTGVAMVAGEITTTTYVDIPDVVRDTILKIGYDRAEYGIDGHTCAVLTSIDRQSAHIAMGVDTGGAGDQGMMFGYASDETPSNAGSSPSARILRKALAAGSSADILRILAEGLDPALDGGAFTGRWRQERPRESEASNEHKGE